jgi:replication factor C small subunit
MNDTKTFLEKYEPKRLDEISGQENIVKIIRGYIKSGNIPHLMFSGDPGLGKTVLSNVIARELFGDNYKSNMISLNASSDRGIDIIRGKVKESTKFAPMGQYDFKIIFMDESDFLTEPAQRALRDIVVKNQNVTRFIFACNDLNKMILPLQDRTQVFRFKRLNEENIYNHLQRIVNGEGINISEKNLMLISELADGSMRKAGNTLQSISTQDEINDLIIKELMGSSLNNKDIEELLKLIKTGNVEVYEKYLFKLIYNEGYNPNEIMSGIINLLIKRNDNKMLPIVVGLAEYSWRMSQGTDELLQLRCSLMQLSKSQGIK